MSKIRDYIAEHNIDTFDDLRNELSNKNLTHSINSLYEEINNWIKREINQSKTIPEIKRDLNLKYFILMFSNILLFFVVCSIDLMNNNAQPVKEG